MPVPDYDMGHVARVAIEGTMTIAGHVQQYVNVMHWVHPSGDVSLAEFEELKDIYEDDLLPAYMDMYYNTVTNITNLHITNVVGPFPEVLDAGQALNGTRTLDTDLLPPYSALVLSYKCVNIGRRFQGRNYFGGFAEEDQQNGVWTSDMQNLVSDFQTALVPYIEGGGGAGTWMLAVLSDPFHLLPDDVPVTPGPTSPFITPVHTMTIRATVFTQKKRKFRNLLDIS